MSDNQVITLATTITGGGWVVTSLGVGGSMTALDATMKPIDSLASAGLGFLTTHVRPLQDVLDRMTGKTSVIGSFADTWQRVSTQVEQIRRQLARSAATDTARWVGAAGDRYRAHTEQTTSALGQIVVLAAAVGSATTTMGQAVAGGRQQAGDLLTDLIRRLISFAVQAIALEGGITSNVLAQTTSMINSYASPISAIEQQVSQTISNVAPLLTALANAIDGAPVAASGETTLASAPTTRQVTTPVRLDETSTGMHDTGTTTRGIQFAQAQATGSGSRRGTVIRLPDGKTIRVRPGGEYVVPLGSNIFEGGQQRLTPNTGRGSVRLPDGTVIRFVDHDEVPTD